MALPEEDVIKQVAAASEQSQHALASPEFSFLLQRIDRLDEKLTSEIRAGDERLAADIKAVEDRLLTDIKALSGEVKAVEDRLSTDIKALSGEVKALDGKLPGEIKAVDDKFSRSLENLRLWAIGAVVTIAAGFIGTIVTLLIR